MKSLPHSHTDIDELLAAAEQALSRADTQPAPQTPAVQSIDWPELSQSGAPAPTKMNVNASSQHAAAIRLRIELIRQTLTPTQIAAWRAQESVLLRDDRPQELSSLGSSSGVDEVDAGRPVVAIYRDDQLVARGELVLIDDHYCCRVTEIIRPSMRRAA
jgi:hypothetical protein